MRSSAGVLRRLSALPFLARKGVLSGLGKSVATTAAFNVMTAGTAAAAGIVIARSLGPTGRGEYAAILAWYGPVHHIGQLGQASATTFFVARHPQRTPVYLATSRNMMAASGIAVLVMGLVAAPLLGRHNPAMTLGYGLMFATCLPAFIGGTFTFSLQSSDLSRWNLVRIIQPALFVVTVGVLHLTGHLGLIPALLALSVTLVVQAGFSYELCRRRRVTGGRADLALARPMMRYGLLRLVASIPGEIVFGVDRLVLSLAVAPAALGQYAVAFSLTSVAGPIVAAVGNVTFPRLASRVLSPMGAARLQRRAVLASIATGVILMLPLALLASWAVPAVFGTGYRDAVPLVWLLAPGGVFFASTQVCSDLLLGYGRPLAVAWAQGAASVVTIGVMAVLLPTAGASGVAIASSVGAATSFLLMMRALRRRPSAETGCSGTDAAPVGAELPLPRPTSEELT